MNDIDHKALADAIRADRATGTPGPWVKRDTYNIIKGPHGIEIAVADNGNLPESERASDARRIARTPDLESAYLQLADEREALLDRVQELEAAIVSCHGPCGCAL